MLGPVVKRSFLQGWFLPIFICAINEKYNNREAIYYKFMSIPYCKMAQKQSLCPHFLYIQAASFLSPPAL